MSLRDQRAAAIRRRIGHGLANDLGRWLPPLLDDLEAIEALHPGVIEAELRAELGDRTRQLDHVRKDFREFADQLVTLLTGPDHAMTAVAGLPECQCGYSLAGGTSTETFILHAAGWRPEPLAVKRADDLPTDDELTAWIGAHPDEFAAWVAKRDRITGGQTTAAARPAARRRAAPKGGTA